MIHLIFYKIHQRIFQGIENYLLTQLLLASIHSKKQDFILQEIFSKLIMYNFAALISYQVEQPKRKRINFAKAAHFCYQFF